jgi:hypothetical protein
MSIKKIMSSSIRTGLVLFLAGLFLATAAHGQELSETESPRVETAQDIGYMGIHIGMNREEVLAAAESNDLMTVPKNRDVDFFPVEEREIITLSIKPEVPFMYLQFFDDVLYAITVIFDERYMDYYTLSSAVAERYGEYTSLTPQWRQWRLDRVTVKVEKPAVVKYIALSDFLEAASFEARAFQFDIQRREQLLDGL